MSRQLFRGPASSRLAALCLAAALSAVRDAQAADDAWIEVASAHFRVISNASQGSGRNLTWQLEQIRSVVAALWPWARVDLNRPLGVIAVKDEGAMRALVPQFWEGKGNLHPASVWVGGADRQYLAIRTDVQSDDRALLNPHVNAYYSYVSLVLQASMARQLPMWLERGLAGVLSNTIVRETFILLGPPIPWHMQRMRSGSRLALNELVTVTRSSPQVADSEGLDRFDAQSWALVHFLLFAQNGTQRNRLDRLLALVNQGRDPATALTEAIGRIQDLEGPLKNYVEQPLFPYQKAALDVSVKREAFGVRPLAPAEAAADRAAFHVAMRRPVEARALIVAARKADPNEARSYVAEGLLLDSENKRDDARTAYGNAIERNSADAHAYYRLASLESQPNADRETLLKIDSHLKRAIELNPNLAPAYAYLAEVRVALDPKTDGALPLARRAIALEPGESAHHVTAARVLRVLRRLDEARVEAQAALSLALSDQAREQARLLLSAIDAALR